MIRRMLQYGRSLVTPLSTLASVNRDHLGAEFSRTGHHTADGISIRFPRVTRIRNDKDYKTATSLAELKGD